MKSREAPLGDLIFSRSVLLGLMARLQWVILDKANAVLKPTERVACSS